jgi:hypothetical protein
MPISHKHKCIFIHIPKNGGSTIEDYLELTGKVRDIDLKIEYNGISAAWRHLPGPTIREIYPEVFEKYYKFAFVRNPYDRVVSEYFWQNRDNPKISELKEPDLLKKFTSWMYSTYRHQSSHKTCQQYRYLYDLDGQLIVDDIFKFEAFNAEIEKLMHKLGTKFVKKIHSNKSKFDIDKNILLTEKNKKFIYNRFRLDFELFKYPENYTWKKK